MQKILRLSPSFIYTVSNLCASLLLLTNSVGIPVLAISILITKYISPEANLIG